MTGLTLARQRVIRQRKRLLAVALCTTSFFTSHLLWGGEPSGATSSRATSVLSEYRKAKGQLGASPAPPSASPQPSSPPPATNKAQQPLHSLTGAASAGKLLRPAALESVPEAPVDPTTSSSVAVPATNAPTPPPAETALAEASTPAVTSVRASQVTHEEANLAPIVPAWSMPRPRKKTITTTAAKETPVAANTKTASSPPDASHVRIQLGQSERTFSASAATTTSPVPSQVAAKLPQQKPDIALSTAPAAAAAERPSAAIAANLPQLVETKAIEVNAPASTIAPVMPENPEPTPPAPLEIHNPNVKQLAQEEPAARKPEPALPVVETPATIAQAKNDTLEKPAVQRADFESNLAVQPARPQLLRDPEDGLGILPPDSPFEAIEQSGSVKLRVRRSILLRTKVDVYRTAIVDESVCDLVQFTPREISIIGRAIGQTHVTFWLDEPGSAPLTYLVEVQADPQQIKADESKYELLQNVINEMFPDSKVYLVLVADKLLVKGQAKDSEEAAQIMNIVRAQASGITNGVAGLSIAQGAATPVLNSGATGGATAPTYQVINMLRVPGVQQVALKVKIAELNRSAARGFGIDAKAAINFSDSAKNTQLFLASMLNATSTTGNTGGTSVVTSFGGQEVNIGLRYLQERGVIRLLSEPTLVTLSGRPATFIAGGEFAVPTIVGSVGLNAVTTDFRAFGAIISFLPTVIDKDRIRLQVAPEFSQINTALTSANNTPGLNVRAATTTVEMREGQTLAIAGLLEDSYKATTVGDLPGLAKIFGRRDTTRSETELIILVTPELVHPMEPEEVPPLPGFDVTEVTATQFFLHGEIEGNPTQDYRSTVWPRLRRRYGMGGPAMTSGPFGHGQ